MTGSGNVSTPTPRFGRSKQLLLNKFFDLSTPSMRKGRNGEEKGGEEEEKNDENSCH